MQGLSLSVCLILCVVSTYSFEIRVAHASPDAPAVDVLVNDMVAEKFTNLQFRIVSKYVHLNAGSYNFKVVPTGKKTPVMLNFNQTINHMFLPFTVVVGNNVASLKQYLLNDDRQRPRRGYSAFRFVHMSPDAPPVDVRFDGQTNPIFKSIGFGQATTYQEVRSGDYTVQLLAAGTNNVIFEHDLRLLRDVPSTAFAEGVVASKNLGITITRDL